MDETGRFKKYDPVNRKFFIDSSFVNKNKGKKMDDQFDQFVNNLQEQIYMETKETFGETVYKRWRYPLYMGTIKNPSGYATLRGSCGDTFQIFLKFDKDRVTKASFQTDGCGPSIACGSFAAEMSIGKTSDELMDITGESILKELGGLPEENEHCAFLAAETLHQAVDDYMIKQNTD